MEEQYRAPKGTSDLIYPMSEATEDLVAFACEILALHGYRLILTPVFEKTELFRRGIGEYTDIVTKEMYTFEDRSGESLTLRPEGTAPVVRAYLEEGLSGKGLPQKLYYYGPMFRRERPQAGRYRQFLQVGAEAIGSDEPLLDTEIISISDIYFRRLGLKRYVLLLNSVGCVECRPPYVRELRSFLERSSDRLCRKCVERASRNPMRVFDCKEPGCRQVLAGAPHIADELCPACERHFEKVMGGLDRMGIGFQRDPHLVRGLDYYTRTAFEFQFEGLGAQNTVSAGGRYDYLAEELGGPQTPGVGFSLGIERLVLALEAEEIELFKPRRLDVFLAVMKGVDPSILLDMIGRIREADISADTDYMERSLKSQMKQADRLDARFSVIVGGKELEEGMVVVRDLDRSSQWEVGIEDIVSRLKELLEVVEG